MTIVEEEGPYKMVGGIKFGILSPNEIRALSIAEVSMADTYDEDGMPITSGLMDGRFGTLEPRQRCRTCGNTASRCPGHFGHIELALPVIHPGFAKLIHKLLNSVCRTCGKILISEEEVTKFRQRINTINRSFWKLGTSGKCYRTYIRSKYNRAS